MGRIRLQICVLPWEQPSSSSSNSESRTRQDTLKWCEPCTEDTSMHDVCDKILVSWRKMFEASMGPLKIRHLKTAYGDFLDLEGRVVGDFFDDRGADGNIRNSILEVHRYPPQPNQIEALQRFCSLAPDSSARPQKRRLELPSHSFAPQKSQSLYGVIPSIEERGAEATVPYGTASKRQRTHESRLNETFHAHHELVRRREHEAGVYHSSRTAMTQEPVRQVIDSQKSPGQKHQNRYDTPTSLPFSDLQESTFNNNIDSSTIPDSPLGRETALGGALGGPVQLDRKSPKSESPELGASIHEASSADPTGVPNEQLIDTSTIPSINSPALERVPITPKADKNSNKQSFDLRQTQEKVTNVDRTHESRTLPANPRNNQSHNGIPQEPYSIFDVIESDTESFDEKQQMQSAERLRSGRTLTTSTRSLRRLSEVGGRKDGQFVVPALPRSRIEGVCKASGRVANSDRLVNIQVPEQGSRDAKTRTQNGSKPQEKHDAETLEDTQPENKKSDRLNIERELPKRDVIRNNLMDTAPNSSQDTAASSQDSSKSLDGTIDLSNQSHNNRASGPDEKPQKPTHPDNDVDGANGSLDGIRRVREAERVAEETEEQQKMRRPQEEKPEWKRAAQKAVDKESAAARVVAESRLKEKTSTAKEGAEDNKARTGRQLSKGKESREWLGRDRQMRETSLAEEANRLMLAAEGAKQIEAEKEKKEKARREELAAQKIANKAKAGEQAKEARGKNGDQRGSEEHSAQESAQNHKDAQDQVQPARADKDFVMQIREQVQKRIADRDMRNLRDSSEAQSRASANSLRSSNSSDPKRSLTPHIPGSSVMQPSPRLNSLASTPFSNRSSGNSDAPLQSTLRQTPSALRRSVSFDLQPQVECTEQTTSKPNSKSHKETDKELTAKSSSSGNLPKNAPKAENNSPFKLPMKPLFSTKATASNITNTPARNRKVQAKLNVTREPKKLKGRAYSPLVSSKEPPKQPVKQETEQTIWQTGNAAAGPSSRKPIFPGRTSQGRKSPEVKTSGASIDPILRGVKIENDKVVASAALRHFTSKSDTSSSQKSVSRSPAQALCESISLSSNTPVTKYSDSDVDSDSEVEPQAPSWKTPTGAKSAKLAPVNRKGSSEAASVVTKRPAGYLRSAAPSQLISHASSSQSRNLLPNSSDDKYLDQAADNQLQLESRQSIPKSGADQISSATKSDSETINQGLDHAGRLSNGIRPTYNKYPSLSQLKKLPRAVTPKTEPKMGTCSQPSDNRSDDSSSDSDEGSTSSNEVRDAEEPPSQSGIKQDSRSYPGMKGLLKIASALRKPIGSSQQ